MRQLDFDVMGFKDSEEEPITGYVNGCELGEGECREYYRPFQISDLISESTPLVNVLTILRNTQRVFLLSGNSVTGIITRADLQKPPVRILLFGLVSLLEMHLSYLVRKFYPDDSWIKKLSKTRVGCAGAMMKQRASRNDKMDLADCLQFCDKRDLVTTHPDILRILDFKSKRSGLKVLKNVEELRDKLAHSQDIVTGTTWEGIIDLTSDLEKLIQLSEEYVDTLEKEAPGPHLQMS